VSPILRILKALGSNSSSCWSSY